MAAADTFRAAAIEQLTEWSNRVGVDIIAQSEGSDPAAVIYDSIAAAKARHADVYCVIQQEDFRTKRILWKS